MQPGNQFKVSADEMAFCDHFLQRPSLFLQSIYLPGSRTRRMFWPGSNPLEHKLVRLFVNILGRREWRVGWRRCTWAGWIEGPHLNTNWRSYSSPSGEDKGAHTHLRVHVLLFAPPLVYIHGAACAAATMPAGWFVFKALIVWPRCAQCMQMNGQNNKLNNSHSAAHRVHNLLV